MSKQIVVRSKPPYKKDFYYYEGNEALIQALEKGFNVKFINKITINNQDCLEYILESEDI